MKNITIQEDCFSVRILAIVPIYGWASVQLTAVTDRDELVKVLEVADACHARRSQDLRVVKRGRRRTQSCEKKERMKLR